MNKRIAIFVRQLRGGGAQRAMVRYATGLAQRGVSVDLLTLDSNGPFRSELHPAVRVLESPARKLMLCAPWIARYLRRERPDTLFTTEAACNVVCVIARELSSTNTRLVLREGLFPSVALRRATHRSTRLAYRLAPVIYPRADALVAIAGGMADDLAATARVSPERITTIAVNPVVTPELTAAASRPPEHDWFSSGAPPVVLGVGRLEAQKDFQTLIRAFAEVRKTLACRLMIIGEGGERNALEREARETGFEADISLPGFIASPYPFMGHCGVFVLSSRFEGLPNVLIEAVASGAPAVSTDCPSGPRDVLNNGEYGELVPVGDVSAMAAAIQRTLSTRPNRARQRSRGEAFTLDKSLDAYFPVLLPQT